MDDQLGQIVIQLMRKSTKYAWVFLAYSALMLLAIVSFLVEPQSVMELTGAEDKFEFFLILSQNLLISTVLFFVFKLFSDSSQSLIARRREFYTMAMDKINKIFEGRYQAPSPYFEKEYGEFQDIILYPYSYHRGSEIHQLDFDKFNFRIIDELDTMYICYTIDELEKFYLSVWHAGNFLAIGIMLEKSIFDRVKCTEDELVTAFQRGLNIQDASNYDSLDFAPRGNFLMLDIKYDTEEMFLKDLIRKDEMSRKIAHIVTVGIPVMMKVLDWEITKEKKTKDSVVQGAA